MKQKVKHLNMRTVIIAFMACIIMSIAGLVTVYAGSYVGWNDMYETSLAYSKDSYYTVRSVRFKIDNLFSYSHNQTIRTASYAEAGLSFFDDINWKAGDVDADDYSELINARLVLERKFRSKYNQRIQVVAATQDTETQGGIPLNDGKAFYYCITEWDSSGNLVFDSNWMDTAKEWRFGSTSNGYFGPGQDKLSRRDDAAYFVLYFRWNTGNTAQGDGTTPISASDVINAFENIYIVYNDFTYTFDANGGTVNGGNRCTMSRFGLTYAECPEEPVRDGYRFKGWKVTSFTDNHTLNCGKQEGQVYTTGELNDMFADGKYYSSFFDDAYFTAQWERVEAKIDYCVNGGYLDSSAPEYIVRTDKCIRRRSDTIQPIHTVSEGSSTAPYGAETFGLKRYGYRLAGWRISGTDIILYPGTSYSYDTYAAHLGPTGYCDLYAVWETMYTGTTVQHYVMGTDGRYPSSPTKTKTLSLAVGTSFEDDYGLDYFVSTDLLVPNGIEAAFMEASGDYVSENPSENIVKVYYRRISYKVTYNVRENYGNWESADSDDRTEWVYYGGSPDLTKKAYKGGWEFAGWSTSMDDKDGLSSYTMGTNAVTLYAVYRKTITTGFVDGQGRRNITVTIYNKEQNATITTPALRNYDDWENVDNKKPIGWCSGTNVSIISGNTVKYTENQKITVTENSVYYGLYEAEATISYDTNGGEPSDDTKPVTVTVKKNAGNPEKTVGENIILPDCKRDENDNGDGTVTDYEFAGWKDDDDSYPPGITYPVIENKTLTADWGENTSAITYKIVFDMNGGKNGPEPITARFGETVTLPADGNRVGFTLSGWNTKPDGSGSPYELGAQVKNLSMINNSTVTLYAQWKQRAFMLVKIGSSRYGATFVRRTEGDDEWYNTTGKLTINDWAAMTQEEKEAICVQRWHISKEGTITRVR